MVSPYRGRYSGLRPRAWLAHFAGSNPKCGRRPPARIHPAAVPRTGLINTSPGKRSGPQGLKPALLSVLNGTAEAVPYPKPFMRPVLVRTAGSTSTTAWLVHIKQAQPRHTTPFQQPLMHVLLVQ